MHDHYWQQLADLDRAETTKRTGCVYLPDCDSFAIRLLNSGFLTNLSDRTVRISPDASTLQSAGYLEQLCLLAYLVNAREVRLSGKLVTAEKLEPGAFFFRGSHRLAAENIEDVFGQDPQLLCKIGQQFDAVPRAFGDASIELLVLPRIPITLIVWAKDEEFPARASVLFDQTATAHLPLDVLYAAATLTIKSVVTAAHKET